MKRVHSEKSRFYSNDIPEGTKIEMSCGTVYVKTKHGNLVRIDGGDKRSVKERKRARRAARKQAA